MRAARTDGNHSEVVKALYAAGMKAQSLASVGQGVPDLIVGYRNINVFLEVKDSDKCVSKKALTAAEADWHATWPGQVAIVETPEQAVLVVIAEAQKRGVL